MFLVLRGGKIHTNTKLRRQLGAERERERKFDFVVTFPEFLYFVATLAEFSTRRNTKAYAYRRRRSRWLPDPFINETSSFSTFRYAPSVAFPVFSTLVTCHLSLPTPDPRHQRSTEAARPVDGRHHHGHDQDCPGALSNPPGVEWNAGCHKR